MRTNAKDETKWNVKSAESLKLLILFLYCSFNKIWEMLLYWYTGYKLYLLQNLPDFWLRVRLTPSKNMSIERTMPFNATNITFFSKTYWIRKNSNRSPVPFVLIIWHLQYLVLILGISKRYTIWWIWMVLILYLNW